MMLKSFLISKLVLLFMGIPGIAMDSDEARCMTTDGMSGFCVPIVQCPNRGPTETACETNSFEGVCCLPPPDTGRMKGFSYFFQQSTVSKTIATALNYKDFDEAVARASQKFQQKIELEKRLVQENIVAKRGSPAFLRNAHSKMSISTKRRSQFAEIAIKASQDLAQRHSLSSSQPGEAFGSINLRETNLGYETCPIEQRCPFDSRYRTIDGSCNNRFYSTWGESDIPFLRILPPQYDDGVSSPKSTSISGNPLRSARTISQALTITSNVLEYKYLTLMVMQWGQFLDHDITLSPISTGENHAAISCCDGGKFLLGKDLHDECYPITIPNNDPFFSKFGQECMDFVRSLPSVSANCSMAYREQINIITAYIDASNVYGSNEETEIKLRSYTDGLLRANTVFGKELLPIYPEAEGCDEDTSPGCFLAGDVRVNEQVYLAVIHTLWLREHNRIARMLRSYQPFWNDEILFQETRRIVGAMMQHITYNEWLPIILGRSFMSYYGLFPRLSGHQYSYDFRMDASITNAFATAAFRFGHTLVSSFIQGLSASGALVWNETLSSSQFRPFLVYNNGAVTSMLRSLTAQRSQVYDNLITGEIKNKLFAQDEAFGMDLIALNIQRGRDHGLPSYNEYRRVCGLPVARTFSDLKSFFGDPSIVDSLINYYDDVNDIDLFLGGILEPSTSDSLLGETFQCIVGEQFIRLKFADRFYYENAGFLSSFTPEQLTQLRKASLSRVICDNTDITEIQPLAFFGEEVFFRNKESRHAPHDFVGDQNARFSNTKVDCDSLPWIDLRVFV